MYRTLTVLTGFFMILIFSACEEPIESDSDVEQARSLYQQNWHDPAIIDSCLILVDKALARNQSNKEALDYKVFLQTQARDLEGLSATVKQLVAIYPESPYYLSLKAWTLDLAGEDEVASQVYDQAESRYRSLLNQSPDDFDLHIEYVGLFVTKGDTLAMKRYLDQLASMDWEPIQMELIESYPSSAMSREELFAFWDLQKPTSPAPSPISPKEADHQDDLPIHGVLLEAEREQYYPGILDTVQRVLSVGGEHLTLTPGNGIIVSILHNTGTFDQMFLCTHDSTLSLLDHLYIGKTTTFDSTSHTIEYETLGKNQLVFQHLDWGFVDDEREIDTNASERYTVEILPSGEIVKN